MLSNAEAILPNIRLASTSENPRVDKDVQPSWFDRQMINAGAKTMSQPTKPYWNPTMVSIYIGILVGVITILGAVGGLYVYTRDTNLKLGDEHGYQRAQQEQMQKQLEQIAADEKRRKELEIYNSRQTDEKDGHAIKKEKK